MFVEIYVNFKTSATQWFLFKTFPLSFNVTWTKQVWNSISLQCESRQLNSYMSMCHSYSSPFFNSVHWYCKIFPLYESYVSSLKDITILAKKTDILSELY